MDVTPNNESEDVRTNIHLLPPHVTDAKSEEGERRMSAIEADRLDLYQQATKSMTQRAADTLMEHLPPLGWGDVARKSDIVILKEDIVAVKADITNLRTDMTNLKVELRADILEVKSDLNKRIDRLWYATWVMIGIMFSGFFGIMGMMFTMLK